MDCSLTTRRDWKSHAAELIHAEKNLFLIFSSGENSLITFGSDQSDAKASRRRERSDSTVRSEERSS